MSLIFETPCREKGRHNWIFFFLLITTRLELMEGGITESVTKP